MRLRFIATAGLLASLGTACVSSGKYDAAVAEAERSKAALTAARRSIADAETLQVSTASELQKTTEAATACRTSLDEATAMNQELRNELERLGKNADALLSAKGVLSASLDQARTRLEELRKAQAAAEARALLFREVALRLKRMVDAGELQILLRSGRMVLVLPTDVLFDSGKAIVKPRGREALSQVASVLTTVQGRRFQVAGHTDDEPVRVSGFRSNWALSTERGLAVVDLLIENGVRPEALSAAGYGEFDPIAANDSPEHKAKNRRIEITIQPNVDEFVAVPQPR